jgi:hypothetical protein
VTIEICKQIASELGKRYMEIMDYGGDQSEADSVGTPFKDGHLAIEFALKEIERLTAERDEAMREAAQARQTIYRLQHELAGCSRAPADGEHTPAGESFIPEAL